MKKINGPEFPPLSGNAPKKLIIFLHGLGSNGMDLLSLVEFFNESMPDSHFLSPNAPFRHPELSSGYQWFDYFGLKPQEIYEGVKKASLILENFIKTSIERFSLQYKDVILVGFSQGTMMSLHTAPRLANKIGGVIGFSGALINPLALEKEIKSTFPVLLIHGDEDNIVDHSELKKATDALKNIGFDVKAVTETGEGHTIGQKGIEEAKNFMLKLKNL